MGQQHATFASKPETLLALQRRVLRSDDAIFDELLEAARNPQALIQLTFAELSSVVDNQPINIAILLYRLATSLYALMNAKKIIPGDILAHLRLLYYVLPPTVATTTPDLVDTILFHKGPLDTSQLIKGPRKIIHPPPSPDKSTDPPPQMPILRVPGPESNANMTLAESLTATLAQLLFVPGFTISSAAAQSKQIIWGSGIGCESAKSASNEILTNRTEVLRTILACLSAPIYRTSTDGPVDSNVNWLSLFVSDKTNKYTWEIFCSLINTGLTYDPVGWGLPYNYLLSSDNSGETLAEVSLHTLLVLLNRHETLESASNSFQIYMRSLGKENTADFKFIFANITTLLKNPLKAKNTYLPGSGKPIQSDQEILLFFWTFISSNKAFMQYILNKEDVTGVAGPIIYYILTNRRNDDANGFVHMGAFSLLMLSGERKFGVQMNKSFDKLFSDKSLASFTGSFNDYYILVMHKILLDSSPRLAGLHDTMLTILVNISPFITSLSMTAAMKLAKLFELFATPKNLLSNQNCHRYVQLLLEAFNNLIQYQYAGNAAIVYSVVQNHQIFKNLTNLRIRSKKEPEEQEPNSKETKGDEPKGEEPKGDEVKSDEPAPEPVPERWIPTNEWLQEWKSQLPLSTTIRLINAVLPDVLQLAEEK